MNGEMQSRIIKAIISKYPSLRSMVRNHPYSKIVGMSIIKCVGENRQIEMNEIDDQTLIAIVEKCILVYHENEASIDELDVVEHKRNLLCTYLRPVIEKNPLFY